MLFRSTGAALPSTVNLSDVSFISNRAHFGGAIYNSAAGLVNLSDKLTFASNNAEVNGGAVYNDGRVNAAAGSVIEFESNAAQKGGAVL